MILSADIGSTCTYVEKLISWCSRNVFWKQEGNTDGNLFVQGLLADYRQIVGWSGQCQSRVSWLSIIWAVFREGKPSP